MKVLQCNFWIFSDQPKTLTIPDADWCRGDYEELLPGRYMNGRTSEILCHDRETGLSLTWFHGILRMPLI